MHTHPHTHIGPEGISLADSHPYSWMLSHCACIVTDQRAGETHQPFTEPLGHSTAYAHVHIQHARKTKWIHI